MIALTVRRLRSIISASRNDAETIDALRRHSVKFSRTDPEIFRIPCRTGAVIVRSFEIHNPSPVPYNHQEV